VISVIVRRAGTSVIDLRARISVIVRELAASHVDQSAKAGSAADPSVKVDSAAALAGSMDSTDARLVKGDTAIGGRSVKAASAAVLVGKADSNRDLHVKVDSRVDQSGRAALANQVAPNAKADTVGARAEKAVGRLAQAVQSVPADLAGDRKEMVDRAAVASKSGD